jgi:hypothetical protein
MLHKEVYITYADGSERGRWPIDNDVIVRAANMEAFLHNRDFPDDPWEVGIYDPEAPVPDPVAED